METNTKAVLSTEEKLNKIFELFEKYGKTDYLGDPVSKLEHSIQCAMIAEREGYPRETILGAFLHDVGHMVGEDKNLPEMMTHGINFGTQGHDEVGARFLEDLGVPTAVTKFVRGHVQAKRYKVYKDQTYYNNLSSASKTTLEHQGGPMTEEEAIQFEADPEMDAILKMRTWDELAKDPNVEIEPLEKYKDMCREILSPN